jgi:hypothetical protein
MDIDELQTTWTQMSEELEKQKRLTNKIILKMTKQEYKSRLDKITIPEILGTLVSYAAAIFILFNFNAFDTVLLKICGFITLVILIILPYLSWKYLKRMRNLDIANISYKDGIVAFTKSKRQFLKLLRVSAYLGFVLMLIIIPVTTKLFDGEDIFAPGQDNSWLWFLPLGIGFYYFFTKKVIRNYSNNINKARDLLKELEPRD